MIQGSIHQKYRTIINIDAPKNRVHKYVKQTFTELKGKTDNNSGIFQYFTPHFQI